MDLQNHFISLAGMSLAMSKCRSFHPASFSHCRWSRAISVPTSHLTSWLGGHCSLGPERSAPVGVPVQQAKLGMLRFCQISRCVPVDSGALQAPTGCWQLCLNHCSLKQTALSMCAWHALIIAATHRRQVSVSCMLLRWPHGVRMLR